MPNYYPTYGTPPSTGTYYGGASPFKGFGEGSSMLAIPAPRMPRVAPIAPPVAQRVAYTTPPPGNQVSLGSTLPPTAGHAPQAPGSYYQPSYLKAWQPGDPINASGTSTGYAGSYAPPALDIPQGVDENWYRAFMAEHPYTIKTGPNAGKVINLTPEQVYERDGEYAIAHALADKAWGDQFYRTYGRPPSEYDWKYSYADRQRAFYNGG